MPNAREPECRYLYRWQLDALASWYRCGRRGAIEAVTGSGKTDMAIAAAIDAHRRGLFVLIVVPSRVLLEQWCDRLAVSMPSCRIGRLGDGGVDTPEKCDVLVATRHSAAAYRPFPPTEAGGLLIADECHGFAGGKLRKALLEPYQERLGLTATLERADNGVNDILLPYFGGLCFQYDFGSAISDGVCAQPCVAFVGVPLSLEERLEYIATESHLVAARQHLRGVRGVPREPFGAFLAAVGHLAEHDSGVDGRAAREYLDAFGKRRMIVAASVGKYELLGSFAPTIKAAHGALLFTETVRAANHAINRLDPLVSIEIITGSTARRSRRDILEDLRNGKLDVVAAPRVLDEGIDVPDANLGIVMSASRTRRQMIQRMGRILRRKRPGVGARFVIMFAKDTIEDPRVRLERDGFLDEIERIALASRVFDSNEFDELGEFLDRDGPLNPIEPERVGPMGHGRGVSSSGVCSGGCAGEGQADRLLALCRSDPQVWACVAAAAAGQPDLAEELEAKLGAEVLYAHLNYLEWDQTSALHEQVWERDRLRRRNPARLVDPALYIDIESVELPEIAKPRVPIKTLSTGAAPIELRSDGSTWMICCTGCGACSESVRFRWQALDQTVQCRCP